MNIDFIHGGDSTLTDPDEEVDENTYDGTYDGYQTEEDDIIDHTFIKKMHEEEFV
jgi:hypothetical protein